ncbi:phage antirepressor KilAC domain-containing protein [Streptomyces xiamenensis]|uniref:phage antirepressor KilAC domain-containing protein n=1 Tax=Streptomyces xiamenensis TaxID=408015 RepID=UPI0036CE1023
MPKSESPFDALRQVRGDGSEFWSARSLMPVLSYSEWERFAEAVEQARGVIAAQDGEAAAEREASRHREAFGRTRQLGVNYHLSRRAAYLTAMRGDSRKEQIQQALVYFAVRTPEAEVNAAVPVPRSLPEALRAYAAEVEAHEETRLRVSELEPKAAVHDVFLAADGGDRLVRQVAKEMGWREKDLRAFLLEEKVIYRRERACGDSEYDFYAAHAGRFTAVEKLVEHLWGACAHYTLYVTPAGMAFIQGRIDRGRKEMQQAIRA